MPVKIDRAAEREATTERLVIEGECSAFSSIQGATVIVGKDRIEPLVMRWLGMHFGPLANRLGVESVHGRFRVTIEPMAEAE